MKRRTTAVALLSLALSVPVAYAAAPAPKEGAWKAQSAQSDSVRFTVKKVGDDFRAGSTSVSTVVGCDAPNPRDSTYSEQIKQSKMTVKLRASGDTLRGSRTVTSKRGKTTKTVKIAIRFTSARRAKVIVNATSKTTGKNVNPNAANCGGRVELTAKPR